MTKKEEINGTESKEKNGDSGSSAGVKEIDFSTFMLSLFTTAEYQLGEIANPYTGEKEQDLNLARETIDIMAMLEKKTEGNLSAEEKKLVDNLLYNLRMKYLQISGK